MSVRERDLSTRTCRSSCGLDDGVSARPFSPTFVFVAFDVDVVVLLLSFSRGLIVDGDLLVAFLAIFDWVVVVGTIVILLSFRGCDSVVCVGGSVASAGFGTL